MRKRLISAVLSVMLLLSFTLVLSPEAAESALVADEAAATPLSVNQTALSLGVGEQYTLRVTGASTLRWSSSSGSVSIHVKADGAAQLTAVSKGSAVVTATAENGAQVTCKVSVLPLADQLKLNKTSLTLGVGEEYDLDSYVPSGTEAYFRMYSSSNAAVAPVSAAGGIVRAVSVGTAEIICTLDNGVTAQCTVTVRPMAQSMSLNYSRLTLKAGEQADLDSYVPKGYAAYHRDYLTDNADVVSVAKAGGIVTALSTGKANVYCEMRNGVRAVCEVEVISDATEAPTEPPTESETYAPTEQETEEPAAAPTEAATAAPADKDFKIAKSTLTLGVGEAYTLRTSGAGSTVSWTADSPVVSVTDNGDGTAVIRADAAGASAVTALTAAGSSESCAVTVLPMADSLTLNKTSLTLGVGEEYDLDSYVPKGTAAYFRTYSSSKASVASVAAAGGIVKAKAAGTATVSCTLENGVKAQCTVTVLPMAGSLTLNKTSLTLGVGEEYDLDSYAPKGTAAYFRTYSSSKASVASVAAAGGIVKAKAAGKADIYCTLKNGAKVKCAVTVKPLPTALSLNKTRIRLPIGGKFDLNSDIPSGTAAYYRYYYSKNTSVAKVTKADGIVTAVAEGTVTVYCELKNGTTAECEVQVMSEADSQSAKNGITVNYHGHNNYDGKDVWGENTLEASVVDWMIGKWPCCCYFEGNAEYRCAEFGRYVRNTRAASQSTTDFTNLKMTPENLRKIAKGCKPGTTLSFGPQYVPLHMIVLLRVTDDRIWWVDCNWNWDNRIHYREATLEDFVNFNHWLPSPDKNGYIISITRINRLNTFSKPETEPARYLNRGDVRIVWTKVDGAKSYEVYQVTGKGDKLVSTQTSTAYINEDSVPGTKYTYYVKAVMSNNKKITGNKVSVYGRIDAPYLELDRANKCIKWNAVEGASGYKIYRRDGYNGSFRAVTTVKGTTYRDSVMNFKADDMDITSYRVQAISSKGESASSVYSDMVVVTREYCLP